MTTSRVAADATEKNHPPKIFLACFILFRIGFPFLRFTCVYYIFQVQEMQGFKKGLFK